MTIREAFEFAKERHAGQTRKGTDIPYWTHLRDVAGMLSQYGADEFQVIAGILHDVLEDTETEHDELLLHFGPKVAAMVMQVTKDKGISDWDERYQDYLKRVRRCDPETRPVFVADKLSNLSETLKDYVIYGDEVFKRFTKKERFMDQYRDYLSVIQGWELDDITANLAHQFTEVLFAMEMAVRS